MASDPVRRPRALALIFTSVVLGACGAPEPLTKAEYEREAQDLSKQLLTAQDGLGAEDFPSTQDERVAGFETQVRYYKALDALEPPAEIQAAHNAWVGGSLGIFEVNLRCTRAGAPSPCSEIPRMADNPDLFVSEDPLDKYLAGVGFDCLAAIDYDVGLDPGATNATKTGAQAQADCRKRLDPKTIEGMRRELTE